MFGNVSLGDANSQRARQSFIRASKLTRVARLFSGDFGTIDYINEMAN
jgi:hypothetical protein